MDSSGDEGTHCKEKVRTDKSKAAYDNSPEVDLSVEMKRRINASEGVEKKRRLNNNDETKEDVEKNNASEEDNGFLCHRLSYSKNKEIKDSDKSEELSTRTFQDEEQDHPMDASIKSLNGCVNSFINRLQIPSESSNFSAVHSPNKDSTNASQAQRTPVAKPSFLITDILSDNSKKDRPGSNLLIDPRALALQHRMFLDRPLTGSSCSSEPSGSGINRFTDNESDDYGDDRSENDGRALSDYDLHQ